MLLARRSFTKGLISTLGAASVLPTLSACDRFASYAGPKILSARTEPARGHFVGAYTPAGETLFELGIPQRGHGMIANPVRTSEIIFFSRRPGMQLYKIDVANLTHIQTIEAEAGRHFYGHGSFSADGRWLYTTENNYEEGQGVIVVRDAQTLEVVEEFPSYGIGPHELHLMPDQTTLVVANGGILTHPSRPGENLNIPDMQPSLVYIDASDGRLMGEFRLPYSQLGIRHIDVNTDGRVVIATQIESEAELPLETLPLPLVATHKAESELQLFQQEVYSWQRLQKYCGSVSVASGDHASIAAVSSPRSGRLALLNVDDQQLVAEFSARDICGVAYSEALQGFLATTGAGSMFLVDVASSQPEIQKLAGLPGVHWDNHLLVI